MVGDSKLVISQVVGEWKTRDSKWIPYQELAERLVSLFDEVVFVHVPRDKKSLADAIATQASIVEMPLYWSMESLVVEKPAGILMNPAHKTGRTSNSPSLR